MAMAKESFEREGQLVPHPLSFFCVCPSTSGEGLMVNHEKRKAVSG